jgi:ABC-2 type transport system ATP-binding protein
VLCVRALSKSYSHGPWGRRRRIAILQNVSFEVNAGEIVGLAGANGAGKTTLLHAIAGLVRPDGGCVELDRRPLTSARAQREVALCSSADRSFYYRLTLRDNLRFFGRLHGLQGSALDRRIAAAIDRMDLTTFADRTYSRCSTGTRQRLTFARALLSDAQVLLLDEPTRAVDPLHAQRLHRFIKTELAGDLQKTVVLATNVLDEAWSVCDRVVILSEGRSVAVDTPAALRSYSTEELFGEVALG